MVEIEKLVCSEMPKMDFDSLALGVLDFNSGKSEYLEYSNGKLQKQSNELIFDLASLTKPLVLGFSFLIDPKLFTKNELLLLNHRASLPSWGRLSFDGWKQQIMSYPISESETCYSDFSALRLMLELELKLGHSLKSFVSDYWLGNLKFWKDLDAHGNFPATGQRNSKQIKGVVHDDNAFVINDFCSHAGLFSDVKSLMDTLDNMNKKYQLIDKINQQIESGDKNRFVFGWDTVENTETTLAGRGCHQNTFGHLGFTGTSIWIDPKLNRLGVILTNATQQHWYSRDKLNSLRRHLGQLIWSI